MLTRRRFVGYSALSSSMLAYPPLLRSALGQTQSGQQPIRLAILGSTYRRGSNMQTIADRFLVGFLYEGDWRMPNVKVVSVYVDERIRRASAAPNEFQLAITGRSRRQQPRPPAASSSPADAKRTPEERWEPMAPSSEEQGLSSDLSQARAQQFGFRLCHNIPEALRCGGDRIAVDAVLAIVEQCNDFPYPTNDRGQVLLPRYDFFEQCAQVFETEKHSIPYFNHKQLSFSFSEAERMVKTAERLKFPLMAGSSMPVTWRLPDVDVPLGARVEEAVMVGVGGFDGTDFDALEAMQCMLERRKGGESGVKSVQLLEGDEVWAAGQAWRWSKELLSSALSRSDTPLGLSLLDGRPQDLVGDGVLPQLVKDPAAYCIEYTDGTKGTLLMLNGAIRDFNISARLAGQEIVSTQFFMPVAPNETYSACLTAKIDQMYQERKTPYPVRRTLLTTGMLEACLNSRHRLNQRLETPHLGVSYQAPAESQYVRS
ncbi:hypothetical protein [Edaphobacter aggregans]|uniref:hypothetical protein n=1 Tax=Edaphobacter aggregans TaxID=570835 RepID=UPI0005529F2D|nr:hypothetical protein [Edaphobacter aggregans]